MTKKRRQRARANPADTPAPAAPVAAADAAAVEDAPGVSIVERLCAAVRFCAPHPVAPAEPVWNLLPWLLLLAFILRAGVALSGDFVLHPDEVMQYLEPAHGMVFGSKVSYWEYYYGARSYLVPTIVAAVLWLCKGIGLGEPAYYIPAVKLFFCALSLLIPLGMYVVGRRLFGEPCARIALLFGVFWYELVGFAHKPMTEFVATALFFALLVFILRPQRLPPLHATLACLLAVLIVAVRFQYAFLVGVALLVPFLRAAWYTRALMVLAGMAGVAAVGMFEYATWGSFMHSYWVNYQVNVVLNEARGEEASAWRYLAWPMLASGGLFLLTLLWGGHHPRRYIFLLLLCVAVVVPHATQAHREYRFIFATIPLWLLVFSHLIAVGWHVRVERSLSGLFCQGRRALALGYGILVSCVGIANAIPLQGWLYEAHSQETGVVNFLHGQDEAFAIYRRLAADEEVRGVKDATRVYFNTGGYYYLHHQVPFYDITPNYPPPEKVGQYVSHIIAPPFTEVETIAQMEGAMIAVAKSGDMLRLPSYIADAALNKLTHRNAYGQVILFDEFTLVHSSDNFTLWKAKTPAPVRTWRGTRVYPDNEAMYPLVAEALGDKARQPLPNRGIEFTDTAGGNDNGGGQ